MTLLLLTSYKAVDIALKGKTQKRLSFDSLFSYYSTLMM